MSYPSASFSEKKNLILSVVRSILKKDVISPLWRIVMDSGSCGVAFCIQSPGQECRLTDKDIEPYLGGSIKIGTIESHGSALDQERQVIHGAFKMEARIRSCKIHESDMLQVSIERESVKPLSGVFSENGVTALRENQTIAVPNLALQDTKSGGLVFIFGRLIMQICR